VGGGGWVGAEVPTGVFVGWGAPVGADVLRGVGVNTSVGSSVKLGTAV